MKFSTHILAYNLTDPQVRQVIDNCGPHVDKIYVSYSNVPWTYRHDARSRFVNTTNIDLFKTTPYASKTVLIPGEWSREEDQRNACADAARRDGMDILFTQDADEYYFHADYDTLKKNITDTPGVDYYKTPWCSFWKSWEYRIVDERGDFILGYPEIAINLHRSKFINYRIPSGTHGMCQPICYHGSFVLTDTQCYEKINTWGHSHEFNTDQWFRTKWVNWTSSTTDLHPINPPAWKRAVEYNQPLPESLLT